MSIPEDELIERVRRGYEAFNRGDREAATRWVHPEVVVVSLSPPVLTFDHDGRVTRLENYLEHEQDEARRSFRAP